MAEQLATLNKDSGEVYSTDEKIVGTWLGKPLYQKTYDCGALLNNAGKIVPYNVSNLKNVVAMNGFTTNGTDILMLPHMSNVGLQYQVSISATANGIYLVTGNDRTSFTTTYVTIRYTKTTD